MTRKPPTITVGQLRAQLATYPDDFQLDFSGLGFYRVKQRGEREVQVEFDQTVYLGSDGRVAVVDHSPPQSDPR